MLLSSMAEASYWCGRYVERAQALSRAVLAYERLSMDLPSSRPLDFKPLWSLVGTRGDKAPSSRRALLEALAFDEENPSSVLGALSAARENLRNFRVIAPPDLWHILNRIHARARDARGRSEAVLLEVLEETLAAGERFEGAREGVMLRDASYAFLTIGSFVERADMQLRVLRALSPVLHPDGWERAFDDVRWTGLLDALGVTQMYRRQHHLSREFALLMSLLLVAPSCPRSLASCLHAIERQLSLLPRSGSVREALARVERDGLSLISSRSGEPAADFSHALASLEQLHSALETSYFPTDLALPESREESVAPSARDPFSYLGREHEHVEGALRVLDELSARAARGEQIETRDLRLVIDFLSTFGELTHHEKEESILTPALVASGFDWYDGPIAVMRRDHRQEHHYVRQLMQWTQAREAWTSDALDGFVRASREFCRFMRGHMDHERRDLFEQAGRSLSPESREQLLVAFTAFDAAQPKTTLGASALSDLLRKYGLSEAGQHSAGSA